jgi:hypothetical protein
MFIKLFEQWIEEESTPVESNYKLKITTDSGEFEVSGKIDSETDTATTVKVESSTSSTIKPGSMMTFNPNPNGESAILISDASGTPESIQTLSGKVEKI